MQENGQRQFQMVVVGRDGPAVEKAAAAITSEMKRLPQIAQVVSTAELERPELRVVPDAELAARLGVSTEAIAEAVRIATIGDVGPQLAKFDAGDRQVPIRVQLARRARAPTRRCCARCGCRRRRARPCRSPRSPRSRWARGRPRSTATTASGASRSAPISSATRRSARRSTR